MSKKWLDNKTILITGASSGIGGELAKIFITKHNAKVIGVGRSEEKMKNFKHSLGEYQGNFEYKLFDVGVEKNWKDLAESLQDKTIDILINNAGVLPPFASIDKFFDMAAQDDCIEMQKIMNINFMSVVYSIKYLSEILEKSDSPAIINISSSAGLCALPGIAMYSASKAAVKNFTECLMLERDYYIGLVCPGFTKTNLFRNQVHSTDNKLIDFISTNLDKMAYKIYKGIAKKKKRMVMGFDAKAMDRLYRLCPKGSLKMFRSILKKSKVELFDDVFKNKNRREEK